ncbi:hypothetical protein Cgig2_031996 [Carnegiea gigantea]|uniref:Dirigent protein n=1 Tax=Carnegiea gigantea TaxID=171969 RepID=A0A9Q1QC28_9CARY|nr:hypothetical protein Cgig2_027319 [Carnegiea gigantea]KAJ8436768.1 hypothetical protein Cgig2_031996 [Carnegiea gigantea]
MTRVAQKIKPSQFLLSLSLLSVLSLASFLPPTQAFMKTLKTDEAQQVLGLDFNKQKLSHFRVYWHDILSGPTPTSVRVVKPVSPKSKTAFGLIDIIDNPLTEGPDVGSKLVGRAQGFYASACQTDVGLLMTMNFAITEGKYNGSTFTVLGRNMVFTKVREMAVIGGSGLFSKRTPKRVNIKKGGQGRSDGFSFE